MTPHVRDGEATAALHRVYLALTGCSLPEHSTYAADAERCLEEIRILRERAFGTDGHGAHDPGGNTPEMEFTINHNVKITIVEGSQKLDEIITRLTRIEQKADIILMDEKIVRDALTKIDGTTTQIGVNVTAIGANVGTIGTVAGTISTEVDSLQTALQTALSNGTGVTQDLVDQAGALSDKASALSDAAVATKNATDALVPVLNGIAAKGVTNPVPLPVPPAPAPVIPIPAG